LKLVRRQLSTRRALFPPSFEPGKAETRQSGTDSAEPG